MQGPALDFRVYNSTGDEYDGFHYDALVGVRGLDARERRGRPDAVASSSTSMAKEVAVDSVGSRGQASDSRRGCEVDQGDELAEVWKRFSPVHIDFAKCLGRTWQRGAGGQCGKKPLGGRAGADQDADLCGKCNTKLAHGRVDGPVPPAKLKEFLKAEKQRSKIVDGGNGGQVSGRSSGSRSDVAVVGGNGGAVDDRSVAVVQRSGVGVGSVGASSSSFAGASSSSTAVRVEGGVLRRDSGGRESPRVAGGASLLRRPRVVSGFGAERSDDVVGDQERLDAEANARARDRRDEGTRGSLRDAHGNDLSRSAGGAWSAK